MGKAFDYSKSIGLEAKVVKLFSNELPTIDELDKIIDFIINSPKPLLIHCMRGVDRTGLISAVALILNNYSLERASDELSWKKGFLPYREQDKFRIVINNYEQWLIDNKLNTNKDNFVFWAKNIYRQ
jgi:protein tyrosine/serine phosphatase